MCFVVAIKQSKFEVKYPKNLAKSHTYLVKLTQIIKVKFAPSKVNEIINLNALKPKSLKFETNLQIVEM